MTQLSLRERLARLGPVQDVPRVQSGSPAVFVLRLPRNESISRVDTISGALALAKRGLSLLRAKRVMEAMLDHGIASVTLPTVETNGDAIEQELRKARISARRATPPDQIDVKAIRQSLNLSQEEFSARYGFEAEALRRWEDGRRGPPTAVRSYLQAIANAPDAVGEAFAPYIHP